MNLDRSRQYGIVYGHPEIKYAQDGICYDGKGNPVTTEILHNKAPAVPNEEKVQLSDTVEAATQFLRQVLQMDALPKSAVFSEAEKNNQPWDSVIEAKKELGLRVFKVKTVEMWALPRE